MHKTIFDSPYVHSLLRRISGRILKMRGWRVEGDLPTERKFIAILAGHTSNWDFPIGLSVALQYRVRIFWLGKWKTGFFRIAESADVTVVLAYLDYARKVGGVGPTIHLSGDQKADLTLIKAFYDTVTSRHPGNS